MKKKTEKKIKLLIIITSVVIMLAVGVFAAYKLLIIPEERVVTDMDREYREYMQMAYGEEYEAAFEDMIGEHVNIDYPFFMTRFSKSVKCTITYPDLKSYVLENQDELMSLSDEELKEKLLEACETADRKKVTVTFPAEYDEGFLLLDTDCFEYHDAMSGGLQGLAAERFAEAFDKMYAEVEE